MRALTPWRPFRDLTSLHTEFDDLVSRFFGERETMWPAAGPAVESFVRGDEMVIRADLPGIDPKDVELAIEGHHLVMRGERRAKEERKEKEYLFREVAYGRFERMIGLPEGINPDTIKAAYHDGVLEVTMKMPKGMEAKKVPITVH